MFTYLLALYSLALPFIELGTPSGSLSGPYSQGSWGNVLQSSLKIKIMAGTSGGVGPSCVTISIKVWYVKFSSHQGIAGSWWPLPKQLGWDFLLLRPHMFWVWLIERSEESKSPIVSSSAHHLFWIANHCSHCIQFSVYLHHSFSLGSCCLPL